MRRIVQDLTVEYPAWRAAVGRFELLTGGARADWGETQELLAAREEVTRHADRINRYLQELEAVGCVFKGFEAGLVDFYSLREDRPIFVPVADPILTQSPAEKNGAIVPQRIEVHQPGLEPLEDAADGLELLEILVDPVGVTGDLFPGGDQLLGLAPVRAGPAGQDARTGPPPRATPGTPP